MTKKYNERLKRIQKILNFEQPDRIPIITFMQEWAMSYAGIPTAACLNDIELEKSVYKKVYSDFDFDGTMYNSISPIDILTTLGSKSYFISDDGYSVQCTHDIVGMVANDYEKLIENPFSFLTNTALPRKNANFTGNDRYSILDKTMVQMDQYFNRCEDLKDYANTVLDMPVLRGSQVIAPIDLMLGGLRGFTGLIKDMRRNKDLLIKALEKLVPYCSSVYHLNESDIVSYPLYGTNGITGSFLSPKQFETFLLPTYEPEIMKIHRGGGQIIIHMQGQWEQHFDWFARQPKGLFIACIGGDDIFKAKKHLGANCIVCGGIEQKRLKYGTKTECTDFIKKVIDECACDGGFMFSND
ncbi:MAG: uroporphyrinogen decarboxylase family protein, partial [Eubacterium sp.]